MPNFNSYAKLRSLNMEQLVELYEWNGPATVACCSPQRSVSRNYATQCP